MTSMSKANLFKWRHYLPDLILFASASTAATLSYRQLAEIVNERGLKVNYATIFRWVQWTRAGTTARIYVQWLLAGRWNLQLREAKYLYRAVDSQGKTLDFLLTALACMLFAKRQGSDSIKSQSD